MNYKILIAATMSLSILAVAQSQNSKEKPKPATTQTQGPRDLATGQASGRLEQKNIVHRDIAAREASNGHATGKKTAADDWNEQNRDASVTAAGVKPVSATADAKTQPHASAADLDGDGMSDTAASKNSGHATEKLSATPASTTSPRDMATGQATGKRQHQPVTIRKEVESTGPTH